MKRNLLLFTMLALMATNALLAQEKKYSMYAVGFYNLENLFDTCHDAGKNDYEYLPTGSMHWTALKYTHKLNNMAQVLGDMGTDKLPQIGCSMIGVSEVENHKVLDALLEREPLKSRGWKYCHIEGPDQRGVDCALFYNPSIFTVRNVKLMPYVYPPQDSTRHTRGFLTVSGTLAGEHVTVIVNHWPSRFAGSFYRELAGKQVRVVKDSLQKDDPTVKIIIMGDMNDDPTNKSMSEALGARQEIKDVEDGGLYNPWWDVLVKQGTGTLLYNGSWNLFDQIVVSSTLLNRDNQKDFSTLKFFRNQVFRRDYLFQTEGKYKGNMKRTHAGGVWLDGYSDHLPTVIYLLKEMNH